MQIGGNDLNSDFKLAAVLRKRMQEIPGLVDSRIAEPLDYPTFKVNVDRDRAIEMGMSEESVASSLLTALSGNALLTPTFWLDPKSGVNYDVVSQAPQHMIDSVEALKRLPVYGANAYGHVRRPTAQNNPLTPPGQVLGNVASVVHDVDPAVIAHYNVQRVMDVNAGVFGRDLGSVASSVQQAIAQVRQSEHVPASTRIAVLGESQAMNQSFRTLELGLILAIVLVYMLMAANFQSWLEPLIITMAVPGALAGAVWMLIHYAYYDQR